MLILKKKGKKLRDEENTCANRALVSVHVILPSEAVPSVSDESEG